MPIKAYAPFVQNLDKMSSRQDKMSVGQDKRSVLLGYLYPVIWTRISLSPPERPRESVSPHLRIKRQDDRLTIGLPPTLVLRQSQIMTPLINHPPVNLWLDR